MVSKIKGKKKVIIFSCDKTCKNGRTGYEGSAFKSEFDEMKKKWNHQVILKNKSGRVGIVMYVD